MNVHPSKRARISKTEHVSSYSDDIPLFAPSISTCLGSSYDFSDWGISGTAYASSYTDDTAFSDPSMSTNSGSYYDFQQFTDPALNDV